MNQKGFVPMIVIILVLIGVVVGVYYLGTKSNKPEKEPVSVDQKAPSAFGDQNTSSKKPTNYTKNLLTRADKNALTLEGKLITINKGNIYIYNSSGSSEEIVKSGNVTQLTSSPNKQSFYYSEDRTDLPATQGGYFQKYSVYNLTTKEISPLPQEVRSVQWSLDGSLLVGSAAKDSLYGNQPIIYNVSNKQLSYIKVPWKVTSGGADDNPNDVKSNHWNFTPDGKTVVYFTNDGSLYFLDTQTQKQTLLGNEKKLNASVIWSPNNDFFVYGSVSNKKDTDDPFTAALMKLPSDANSISSAISLGDYQWIPNGAYHPVLWSPDGNKLLLYSFYNLFDVKSGKKLSPFSVQDLKQYSPGAGGQDVIWLNNDTLITVKSAYGGEGLSEDERKSALVKLSLTEKTVEVIYQSDKKLVIFDASPSGNQLIFGEDGKINIADFSTNKIISLDTEAQEAIWEK